MWPSPWAGAKRLGPESFLNGWGGRAGGNKRWARFNRAPEVGAPRAFDGPTKPLPRGEPAIEFYLQPNFRGRPSLEKKKNESVGRCGLGTRGRGHVYDAPAIWGFSPAFRPTPPLFDGVGNQVGTTKTDCFAESWRLGGAA